MEVQVVVPKGTDLTLVREHYPELLVEEGTDDETESHWCGQSMYGSESDTDEWMTYDECVEFCGFVEAVIPAAQTRLECCGSWAMSMMRRKNFGGIVNGEKDWRGTSDLYWSAFERGQQSVLSSMRRNERLSNVVQRSAWSQADL
jgi:hypothetical protein